MNVGEELRHSSSYSLEMLETEERQLIFDDFDNDFAWALGCHIRNHSASSNFPLAIEICVGKHPVFLAALRGATQDNIEWIKRKRRVVERFNHSSLYMRLLAEAGGFYFNQRYALPESKFAAYGGGLPVFNTRGIIIGSVCISGLSDEDDHKLAAECILRLKSLRR